jgi:hypothetical protein
MPCLRLGFNPLLLNSSLDPPVDLKSHPHPLESPPTTPFNPQADSTTSRASDPFDVEIWVLRSSLTLQPWIQRPIAIAMEPRNKAFRKLNIIMADIQG